MLEYFKVKINKSAMNVFSLLVILLAISACSSSTENTSGLNEIADYTYTPGGPDGARIGQHSNFGSRGSVNGRDAWFAENDARNLSQGCLTYGPYLTLRHRVLAYFHAELDISAYLCNGETGRCGQDFHTGVQSQNIISGGASYTVDVTARRNGVLGTVLWSKTFTVNSPVHSNVFSTGPIGPLEGDVEDVEVRVCNMSRGISHNRPNTASGAGLGGTGIPAQLFFSGKFGLGIHKIRLRGAHD